MGVQAIHRYAAALHAKSKPAIDELESPFVSVVSRSATRRPDVMRKRTWLPGYLSRGSPIPNKQQDELKQAAVRMPKVVIRRPKAAELPLLVVFTKIGNSAAVWVEISIDSPSCLILNVQPGCNKTRALDPEASPGPIVFCWRRRKVQTLNISH